MMIRPEIEKAKIEDIENTRKKQQLVQKMCGELEFYLLKKNRGNIVKLQQLLGKGNDDPIYNLEVEFFLNNPTYLKKFNEIAKRYNYFFKGDVQNVLTSLTTSKDLDKDIANYEKFHLINKIEYKEDTFKVETDFGIITIEDAKKQYPEETERMIEKAKKEQKDLYKKHGLDYSCHLTALEYIKMHEEDYLITCMCPHIFNSTWWFHSYILTQDENTVLDFANNIIMEREKFNLLFEPNDLVKIKQSDMERYRWELKIIDPTMPFDEGKILSKLTLMGRAKQLQKRK